MFKELNTSKRKRLGLLLSLIFLFPSIKNVEASDNNIPVEMQAAIFLKALSYDKTITNSNQSQINIGIIVNPESNKSKSNKDNFIENINSSKSGISTKSINTFSVNISSINDMKKYNLNILYLTPDLGSLEEVSKIAKENKTLTWSSDPKNVRNGFASMGVMNKNNRPKIIVNLKNAKQEGHEISSQLLKLSEIIE